MYVYLFFFVYVCLYIHMHVLYSNWRLAVDVVLTMRCCRVYCFYSCCLRLLPQCVVCLYLHMFVCAYVRVYRALVCVNIWLSCTHRFIKRAYITQLPIHSPHQRHRCSALITVVVFVVTIAFAAAVVAVSVLPYAVISRGCKCFVLVAAVVVVAVFCYFYAVVVARW